MRIEFDEPKRQRNLEKHGFDLADFSRCFDRDSAERIETAPSRTGRARYLLIGRWNDEVVVLGGEALSLVSPRRARWGERNTFEPIRRARTSVDHDLG
ncbi:BrnT family toxin [Methylobacterium sp. 17Sr1-1]|uniref:BrnT family toxin n=1 Tax=Methylobacterium sp. 17Sr1-1 TaxID=2202826 RepID=UPI000D6EF569|nr:BrnT family toxin [Methylobacterium sp. 17Sr1-1]AWN51931.1 hypothetical protein DK412_09755 [Methylobacterium sp. 17Sr1-1]